jgi:acetolactate synthase-1/2/3 large subunit
MATVAEVIVSELLDGGVRTLFGVPGGASNLDLIDAAGRAGLRFVLTSTETAAAIAAIAQTEVTGGLGVCLTTLGPGAASAVNGVACAFLDRAPVLVFTDSHPAARFEHQRLDHAALFASITNASIRLTPGNVHASMADAVRHAQCPRPGPVHLDCPGAVASEISSEVISEKVSSEAISPKLTSELIVGRAPLLLIGLGARRPEDAAAIRALCERRRVPAMVTYKAKGVVPDDHPWFAGVFTNGTIEGPLIDDSDVLIGLGLDPVELLPRPWTHTQPIVYAGPWAVEDGLVPFSDRHIAPISECVARLDAALTSSRWDATAVRARVEQQRRAVKIPTGGLSAHQVVALTAARFAMEARVTIDAGAHMLPATMLWPVAEPGRMLISNGLSTMGFALPAAIGAALADPSRPVVALTGDGGLLMCLGELLTAVREQLRIVVVVFNDSALSLIEIKQQARQLAPGGVALGDVDWCALGSSVGMTSFVAADEDALGRALDSAAGCDGPCLIEARIDRSNYGATLRAIRG